MVRKTSVQGVSSLDSIIMIIRSLVAIFGVRITILVIMMITMSLIPFPTQGMTYPERHAFRGTGICMRRDVITVACMYVCENIAVSWGMRQWELLDWY